VLSSRFNAPISLVVVEDLLMPTKRSFGGTWRCSGLVVEQNVCYSCRIRNPVSHSPVRNLITPLTE